LHQSTVIIAVVEVQCILYSGTTLKIMKPAMISNALFVNVQEPHAHSPDFCYLGSNHHTSSLLANRPATTKTTDQMGYPTSLMDVNNPWV
jgi:hypothetical protein